MNIKRKSKALKQLESISGTKLTLGGLLRAIRQGEEKTQTEFSEMLKISKQYLCDLEQRRRFASPKAAVDYAELLGYSQSQFLQLCLQDLIDREGIQAHIMADFQERAA